MVERIFGVIKRRFQIFKSVPEYLFTTEINLVFAITALHNFIKTHQSQEDIYDRKQIHAEREDQQRDNEDYIETRANLTKGDGKKMNEFRDKMAEEMWQDYIHS